MTELVAELGGWASLGATGILAIVVMMVLTGKLIPRQPYLDMMQERDYWRTAHTASEEGRRMLAEQNKELMEVGRTTKHVVHALPLPPNPVDPQDDRPTS